MRYPLVARVSAANKLTLLPAAGMLVPVVVVYCATSREPIRVVLLSWRLLIHSSFR